MLISKNLVVMGMNSTIKLWFLLQWRPPGGS